MRARSYHVVAVVTAIMTLSGCGTAANLCWLPREEGGKQAYGGVKYDIDMANDKHKAALKTPPTRNFESIDGNQCLLFMLDTPISFIGDTITLPVILLFELWQGQEGTDQP